MSAASRGLALSRLAKKVPRLASQSLPSSLSCPSKRGKQRPIQATEAEMGDGELKMETFSHTPEPLEGEEAWNKYQARWEGTWKDGLKPGERFDAFGSAPVFLESLASGKIDVKGKRVVIPGCGRGYDVVESVKAGAAAAVGLEISAAAQKVASAYVEDTLGAELGERGSVVEADFFRWQDPQGGFDVGYDYTFLCALHPSMHPAWAEGWSRILRPGAALVTLMFPINPDRENCGPPWPVSIQLYKDHLLPNGFEFLSAEPVPENLSHPGRGGFETLALWRRLP